MTLTSTVLRPFFFTRGIASALLCAALVAACGRAGDNQAGAAARETPAAEAKASPAAAPIPMPESGPNATAGKAQAEVSASTETAAPINPLETIPVSAAQLPPFPFLEYPPELAAGKRRAKHSDFDKVHMILGDALHAIEGRVAERSFPTKDSGMSATAVRGNYRQLIDSLGAVKVNTVKPDNDPLGRANGGRAEVYRKLAFPDWRMSYDTYVLRTQHKRYWIALMVSERQTKIVAVEEQAMEQQIDLVKAEAMQTALAKDGRIALYINFDTDKATLRPDGKPAVEEIVKLMKSDPALKLSIEGHTDNSGTSAHNKDLSQRRADVVVATLIAAGIDKARLSAIGLGDSKPLADNADEAGRARNRRVELVKQP